MQVTVHPDVIQEIEPSAEAGKMRVVSHRAVEGGGLPRAQQRSAWHQGGGGGGKMQIGVGRWGAGQGIRHGCRSVFWTLFALGLSRQCVPSGRR